MVQPFETFILFQHFGNQQKKHETELNLFFFWAGEGEEFAKVLGDPPSFVSSPKDEIYLALIVVLTNLIGSAMKIATPKFQGHNFIELNFSLQKSKGSTSATT